MKIAVAIVVAIILVPLLLWVADRRPSSPRSRYDAEVRQQKELRRSTHQGAAAIVTEADLAKLPPAVATYLRRAGVVGKPRPRNLHAVFRARMRSGPTARWMEATVEQHDFFIDPARLFFMRASQFGVPFVAYHRFVGPAATFEVRLAGLLKVVDAHGPELNQSETVTLLNDMFFLAPGALVDANILWETVDDGRVKATFSHAGQTVSALLTFNAAGDLVEFVSTDRYQSDGKTNKLLPWSTPLGDFRDVGGIRLPHWGEARWHEDGRAWTYAEFFLERITYE